MRPYRIKHTPTGLYYTPTAKNNLSKKGKIYNTNSNVLNYYGRDPFIYIRIIEGEAIDRKYGKITLDYKMINGSTILYKVRREAFEIEYL